MMARKKSPRDEASVYVPDTTYLVGMPEDVTKHKPGNSLKRLFFSRKAAPYLFVAPFIISFLVFWAVPIGYSMQMSFHRYVRGYEPAFIGMDNYARMFGDRLFWVAVNNSMRYMLVTLLVLIPGPLIFAILVNSKIGSSRIKGFFKSAMFLPALTSVVVGGIIFRLIFSEGSNSLANNLIGIFGMEPYRWLRNDGTGLLALVLLAFWRWAGVNMMYFLAALQQVPDEYYEAASIDGAGKFRTFWSITLPTIKPTILFVVTISVFGGLSMFVESFMLWGANSPQNIGLTIVGYLYRLGIDRGDWGYASAVGVVLLLLVLIINIIQLSLSGFFRKEQR
jgi:arabinosaccharide transport system permease protein